MIQSRNGQMFRGFQSGGASRPGLSLVLGPANSGKMGRVLEWWRDRIPRGAVVVVPTGPDAHGLTVEMVRRAGALVAVSPALTFDGLVSEVLGYRPRYISDFERDLMLRRILEGEDLQALGPMAAFPGTLTGLAGLLRKLEESGRSPAQIRSILRAWGVSDPAGSALADDLARVAALYDATRASLGLTDRPAAVRAARDQIGGWDRPVAFYGFTSFTPGQRFFIEALMARTPVILSLSHDATRSANLVDDGEVARWREVAREVAELSVEPHAYSSPAIAYLERTFVLGPDGAPPASSASAVEGVRFLLASGQRNEAELAAEHITGLIRGGFPAGRIAVVVRHVRTWSALLGQVFESCGIPYRLDCGPQFRATGLGHAFLRAVEGRSGDDAEALLAFLHTPYSGLDLGMAAQIETRYRRAFARGAAALMAGLGEEPPPLLRVLSRAVEQGDDGPRVHVGGLAALARGMLAAGLRRSTVTSRETEEDLRAYSSLARAIEALEEIFEDHPEPGWLPAGEVLPALNSLILPSGPVEGQDAVQVLSPHRARALRFDALFMLGLVEGEFPGRRSFPSLLTESQREHLDRVAGGDVLPPEADLETALFANSISRPWQVLFLSARDADDGGGQAAPSRFWLRCKALLLPGRDALDVDHRRTLADQVFPAAAAPTLRQFRRSQISRSRVISSRHGHTAKSMGPEGWARGMPVLVSPSVLEDLAARSSFSASELEGYLGCPFAWFLQRVVGVESMDSALDGRVLGTLLHAVLSATYRRLRQAGLLPLRPESLTTATKTAFSSVERLVADSECPGTAAEKRLAGRRLRTMLEDFLRTESESGSSFATLETELWVGGREGVDIGGIALRGRVDRVDADRDGRELFVVDYKSGGVPPQNSLGTAKGLQLPLYLMALAAERPGAHVVGGAYVSLSEGKRSGVMVEDAGDGLGAMSRGLRTLDEEGRAQLFQTTLQNALAAADGIRNGRIAPERGRDCPTWCEFGPACRSRRGGHAR